MITHKLLSRFVRTGTRLAILASMLMAAFISSVTPAAAADVPCTVPSDLYAVPGTTTLGTQSVTFWGYNTSAGVTQPGGPILCVTAGDTVQITLHNQLTVSTALLFQGQDMVPDRTGVGPGGTKLYTFTASRPGTYLYEAGLLPGAQYQTAMGLYGALIVRPATAGQAYDDASTAYEDEAVLVLSEIDPALNNRTTGGGPAGFDMRNYNPRYFLINGQTYPNTTPIPTLPGNRVLLRYLNAGIKIHSMAILGMHQTVIANDGSPLTFSHRMVAESFGPGQTVDAIATIPAGAVDGSKFAIYDGNLMLRSSNAAGFGGMLTFMTVSAPPPPVDTTGPVTSSVAYAAGTLTATVDDSTTGGNFVTAAEYFIDTVGATGTGTAMSGTFGSVSVNVSASVVLPSGSHTLYVHGQDNQGNWGAVSSVLVNGGDTTGPATTGPTLTPNPTNGSVNVAVHATGNDSASGGSNIAAGEYTIDGGAAVPMTVNAAAPVASLDATILAATVNALAQGPHIVSIRSQDAAGNWGAPATITLNVDKTAPATSAVSAAPNPNNGTLPINPGTLAVRVTASFADPLGGGIQSNISAAEGFIDTVGANGTGFVFAASDAGFDSPSETGASDIPLATIIQLSNGNHTIYVHAKDAAGNWGPTATTVLLIDKLAPTFTSISLAPNPTLGAANVMLTVNGAADPGGAGLAGGEYWINPPTTTNPAPGSGTQFSGLTANIPVGSLANGTYIVRARIRDAAGNWSTGNNGIRQATLIVAPDAIFSNGFETATGSTRPWGWSSASTNTASRLNVTTGAALVGSLGLQAQGNNTNYVQFNFGTAANPASGTFDARFYFNPHGNTGNNQDIFVARTTGGTTVFRVRYRWNGGSPQVQVQVGTGTGNAAWTGITNSASNRIEVVWQAVGSGGPNPGTLVLYVNGVSSQTLTTTSTNTVGQVRLGSVTSGGNNTLEYFDAFASKRSVSPLIGP
jgi:hypothetical protein